MKVWHLEKEWDTFLDAVIGGREQKKARVREAVEEIKKQVFEQGDGALTELSRRFDGWQKEYSLRISEEEVSAAANKVKKGDLPILRGMIRNVRAYHQWQGKQAGLGHTGKTLGRPRTYKRKGLSITEEFVAVERALVYVPGGQVPYPSSLVMGAVPAQVAGVKEVYVTTPTHDGALNPYIAACCLLLDIKNVYRLGGAQAIYAFARGAGSIPKVDMIVGPGNAYVEEAKRDVYGQVGIDMLAGPSELVILVAGTLSPQITQVLAWDLFSQAEHDEMATVGLFCQSKDDVYRVMKEIERHIGENKRRQTVEKALHANGFLVHYTDLGKAKEALNRIAPEHLEVVGDESSASDIRYPGIIYVGGETCVAMGDYYIGTNHVLPTGGAGRFSAGLSVGGFTKRRVLVKIDRTFLDRYGDKAARMADVEGLFAHGRAIRLRKELLL